MQDVLIGPSAEPIDIALAKLQISYTQSDRDPLVSLGITSARQSLEKNTNQQLVHSRFALTLNRFPGLANGVNLASYAPFIDPQLAAYDYYRRNLTLPRTAIVLPSYPAVAVASITYIDTSGAPQTVDPSVYTLVSHKPNYVVPAYGKSWPVTIMQGGNVVVTYDAGYASPLTFQGATSPNVSVRGPVTFAVDQRVRFSNSGGSLPTEIAVLTDYYVKSATSGVYTFAASAPTASQAALTFATVGTGTSFIGAVPSDALMWMLLELNATFEIHGSTLVLDRGMTLVDNGSADALLDQLIVFQP